MTLCGAAAVRCTVPVHFLYPSLNLDSGLRLCSSTTNTGRAKELQTHTHENSLIYKSPVAVFQVASALRADFRSFVLVRELQQSHKKFSAVGDKLLH